MDDEVLARALQMEADEALAAELASSLAVEKSAARAPSARRGSSAAQHMTTSPAIMIPASERLAGPAHKQVTCLGRSTSKQI